MIHTVIDKDHIYTTVNLDTLIKRLFYSDDSSYPPYDIERMGNDPFVEQYKITLAVAGFSINDLSVSFYKSSLIIAGRQRALSGNSTFLHNGISRKGFEKVFQLADSMEVTGSRLKDGMLSIYLIRKIPTGAVLQKIEILTTDSSQ